MLGRLKEASIAIGFLVVIVGICFLFNTTPFDSKLFFNFYFFGNFGRNGTITFSSRRPNIFN